MLRGDLLIDTLRRELPRGVLAASLAMAPAAFGATVSAKLGGAPRVVAKRAASPPIIDGALDDPVWTGAPALGSIVQREPHEGEPASERTEVQILYDDQNLYLGVVCHDSEPDRVIGTQMARDAELYADDRIEIVFDTFRDRHNAYYFATNPAGALVDGLVIQNGNLNLQWDGIWLVRARRTAGGWCAEIAIPFKTLSFAQGRAWGFNFSRTIQRKLEEDRWAAPLLDLRFRQVSEAGELDGLEGAQQGLGLDVRPFESVGWSRADTLDGAIADHRGHTRGKGGADLFYSITPSLRLTATYNTDFAETEVDDRRTNLTRFPLFFPEKRSFFL